MLFHIFIPLELVWAAVGSSMEVEDTVLLQHNVTKPGDFKEKVEAKFREMGNDLAQQDTGHQKCNEFINLFLPAGENTELLNEFVSSCFASEKHAGGLLDDCVGRDATAAFEHLKAVIQFLIFSPPMKDHFTVDRNHFEDDKRVKAYQPGKGSTYTFAETNSDYASVGQLIAVLMSALDLMKSAIAKTLARKYIDGKEKNFNDDEHLKKHYAEYHLSSLAKESEILDIDCLASQPQPDDFYGWQDLLAPVYLKYEALEVVLEQITCGTGFKCPEGYSVPMTNMRYLCPELTPNRTSAPSCTENSTDNAVRCCGSDSKINEVFFKVKDWIVKKSVTFFVGKITGAVETWAESLVGPLVIDVAKFLYRQYSEWKDFKVKEALYWECGSLKWEFAFVNKFLTHDVSPTCKQTTPFQGLASNVANICKKHTLTTEVKTKENIRARAQKVKSFVWDKVKAEIIGVTGLQEAKNKVNHEVDKQVELRVNEAMDTGEGILKNLLSESFKK